MLRFLAVLFLLVLVAAAWLAWEALSPTGPAFEAEAVFVDIHPGTGTPGIAAELQRAGVIRNRHVFELLRLIKGGTLKAGEYRFAHPASATEVYDRIARGDIFTVALTIPEGYNIFDIAQAVATAGLGSRDTFLAAERSDTALIADLSPHAASLEGFLFPDTYRFARNAGAHVILAAMVRRFRQQAAQLGLAAQPPAQLDRTVILASLIEKEVAVGSERPLVAGVFENRLAQGIPLATDPTIIYAAELAGRWRGTIHASDLKFDSPYNTYIHAGLPPGPICNPGVAALQAAVSPAKTDYLYFVADAQGHSRFASTLAEHTRNVMAYRQAIGQMPVPTPPPVVPAPESAASTHSAKPHSPRR